jgi:hypothetical protein
VTIVPIKGTRHRKHFGRRELNCPVGKREAKLVEAAGIEPASTDAQAESLQA